MALDARPSQTMDKQKFVDEVPRVLLTFQYVEEALRQYMLRANVMIASEVRPFVHYSHDNRGLQKASFGRLISMFARLNSNTELHRNLTQLVQKRNFCAHQAYLASGGMADVPEDITDDADGLERIGAEAERCLQELFEEIQQLEARFVAHKKRGV